MLAKVRSAARPAARGTVRVACVCGSCSWHVPEAWLRPSPGPDHSSREASPIQTCCCTPHMANAHTCPGQGSCDTTARWFRARFGAAMTGMRWLRLPEGVSAEDCNDRSADGVHGELARGIAVQA